jgi:hypothetical protein
MALLMGIHGLIILVLKLNLDFSLYELDLTLKDNKMEYTVNKIEDQSLAFCISMQHNEKEIQFNVVCASSESEIPDLVAYYISCLEAPAPVYQNQPPAPNLQTQVEQQQAQIELLTARLARLETQ